jgi:hypothetical protein
MLCEGDRTEGTRTISRCERDDVSLRASVVIEERQVAIEKGTDATADQREKLHLLHHPAAEDDTLR